MAVADPQILGTRFRILFKNIVFFKTIQKRFQFIDGGSIHVYSTYTELLLHTTHIAKS